MLSPMRTAITVSSRSQALGDLYAVWASQVKFTLGVEPPWVESGAVALKVQVTR
jgi:hypothetical protein